MSQLAKVLRRSTGINIDTDALKFIVIFWGSTLALTVATVMTYAVDPSPVFF
jgi:hypothetical protein